MKKIEKPNLFMVMHNHFCTDHYETHSTIVEANSKLGAMTKLNLYLDTKPDGVYTPEKCKSIKDVHTLKVLS
jgi:hypothetical protein